MLGIMQGRLLPPQQRLPTAFPVVGWDDEFAYAAAVPLDYIEWIYDFQGRDRNPLVTREGMELLAGLIRSSGVGVRSICFNYFMERLPLCCAAEDREQRLSEFARVLRNGAVLGVKRAVLPFLDASAIRNDDDFRAVLGFLAAALPLAEETNIEIHVESSLSSCKMTQLLEALPYSMLKVAYDSGNSASLGFSPSEEFAAFGKRIGSVHIKDRVLHAGSVPLGTGDTDFKAVFDGLQQLNYCGDFTFEAARGAIGDEIAWARKNVSFLREHWYI